jgi:hypothetical protein
VDNNTNRIVASGAGGNTIQNVSTGTARSGMTITGAGGEITMIADGSTTWQVVSSATASSP